MRKKPTYDTCMRQEGTTRHCSGFLEMELKRQGGEEQMAHGREHIYLLLIIICSEIQEKMKTKCGSGPQEVYISEDERTA